MSEKYEEEKKNIDFTKNLKKYKTDVLKILWSICQNICSSMNNYITKNKKWISFTAFCQICTSTTTSITKYNLQLIEYYLKIQELYTYLLYIKTMILKNDKINSPFFFMCLIKYFKLCHIFGIWNEKKTRYVCVYIGNFWNISSNINLLFLNTWIAAAALTNIYLISIWRKIRNDWKCLC